MHQTRKRGTRSGDAVADQLRARFHRPAELMDEAENDVLVYMYFPKHWPQIHSTSPLERINREVKRRTNVVAIFPNEAAIVLLAGAILLEGRRYMSLETLAGLSDDKAVARIMSALLNLGMAQNLGRFAVRHPDRRP